MSKHTYGPVLSRRFGLSLGVDVVPHKWCSLDCVYCQLGRTTRRTVERQAFFPPDEVVADVGEALRTGSRPDVITFAGSGEPTLYAHLGEVASRIRRITKTPLLLITNGTLLGRKDVAEEASLFDYVAPSLDAADPQTFLKVNGPDPSLSLEEVLGGLIGFTREFPGKVFLEILLVAGVNDHPESIRALADAVTGIQPHQVDLNTVSRPSPGGAAQAVSREFLVSLEPLFASRCRAVREFGKRTELPPLSASSGELERCAYLVGESLTRRPSTLLELSVALDVGEQFVVKALERLLDQGLADVEHRGDQTYYVARRQAP